MELRKLFYLLLIIPFLFVATSCSSDDDPVTPEPTVNEAELLVQYLEANGDAVNTKFPSMIPASTVHTNILTGADQYIIDIRSAADYAAGHIQGAVNVPATQVLAHYESNNLQNKATVVIVCYTGQTAGWVTGLLQLAGYSNVKDLKFGMCSWNSQTANGWMGAMSNAYVSNLTTTATPKPAAGELPTLSTGKSDGASILRARIEAIFAEGFDPAKITAQSAVQSASNYFIINYWPADHYNWNHIPGAMQYTPGQSLKLGADLKTIATDKEVVVYCYTGQTSAHVAAFLRVVGYNAKSLLFGVNAIAYDTMPGTKFSPTEVNDYELVQ